MVQRRSIKRRTPRHPAQTKAITLKGAGLAQETPALTAPLLEAVHVAEAVAYHFAGYTATADGATARLWYSRTYTVKSAYAYVGRMKLNGEEVHVWMETAGNALASLVTEQSPEPLPDIAQMMERFPDGGLGVIIADPGDFAPPAEPAVEVVEWTGPSR
ncbi:MAG: hypothetical protein NZ585_10665 [Chloracidobacterium sp.]|nr:hypothetical protein [Chloracidobacterium sp.]MDW8217675.1 hypothetical protein [Acidobacteriota bacterium]